MALQRVFARKTFAFFLSHHKVAVGLFCRHLKMLLERETSGKAFLDVDGLDSLDHLTFTVRTSVENLVICLTSEYFKWFCCAVKNAHAVMCGVFMQMLKILDDATRKV